MNTLQTDNESQKSGLQHNCRNANASSLPNPSPNSMPTYEGLTVAQLKQELAERGLPLSGKKADLIARLQSQPQAEELILEAELEFNQETSPWQRSIKEFLALPIPVIIVTGLLVTGGLGYVGYELVSSFLDDEVDYPELIEFNSGRAREYADTLVGYGHAEWKGRMSGSQEERNAAQYIHDTFEELGYEATLESFSVPMFSIISAPTLQLCVPGNTPLVQSCGFLDTNRKITDYEHRTEVVLQGFSGTRTLNFNDADLINLGNGSEEADWDLASDNIGLVFLEGGGFSSNTYLYSKAAENGLAALLVVSSYNCDKVEVDNCVPIFKGVGVDEVKNANGGSMPDDIAFMMISSQAGDEIWDAVNNSGGKVSLSTNVQNTGNLDIYVPCGKWQGISDELIMAGGHHDTVYHGPGAIDDTSGSATVLELATTFSEMLTDNALPAKTIMFCTWGGEEEGLWGSTSWVEAHQQELRDNLRLYVNLDMNHVDADFTERGNDLTLFSNYEADITHVKAIAAIYQDEKSEVASKYNINFNLLDGDKGESDGMPYNSDHGPFVYDLGDGENGRAVVCYGSGSWEYHTYADEMTHFNEESLSVSGTIYGTYLRYLAEI